ncbi:MULTISPECIES: M64 family metallopeptidase [unclassified Streptomyces]|uniref:M64 family metallopeptidase n=1 Tax=unclassified Streptomyces TaxID=2593676 RepID=UPI002DDA833F|nr:M64 family metallopeptidase [Streptomyces sp. NBC_01750]WSA98733.1 M64 family metallopeptidase [Streptomyces sp. NBC_01794]WSD36697.1 M64 family metallopeptidase [Streptomyces sp. NBC_01750]
MRSARRRVMAAVGAAAALAAVLAATPGSATADPATPGRAGVEVEIPGPEHGTAAGSGRTRVPQEGRARPSSRLSAAEEAADGEVTKLMDNGSTADRLDIVVVGDGYTAAELDRFHTDAREKWAEVAAVEPYTTYQGLFNVWAVDAVSNQSGVSGDPGPEIVRDTALGSYFWCDDIERLLCVDQDKVDGYVAKAPEADLVLVLANSAKYGGAGYNEPSGTLGYEGISTASAGNEKSGQVAIHETGHSLGKLADEYYYPGYPGYEEYTGPEPAESNSSTLAAGDMSGQRAKWHRWLGEESPDGGSVGTYEGGGYYVTGLYRPTDNSLMRTLGKPFNLPGIEAMIAGFYRHANVVTAVTPTDRTLRLTDTAKAAVPRLRGADGRQLRIRWYLDGRELKPFAGRTRVRVSDLALWLLDLRTHTLSVTAEDRTPAVRDPKIAGTLKSTTGWRIRL